MKKRLIFLLSGLYLFSNSLKAQNELPVVHWTDYLEEIAADNENEEQTETLFTELSYLSDHPMELNQVTVNDLKRLPFLSDMQIEDIILYRKKYGKWASVYELKNIESLDLKTISLLLPFVYVNSWEKERKAFTLKNIIGKGKRELWIRYDRGFQQKKGYKSQSDSILQKFPNRKYIGEPFYHSFRYSYAFDERLQWGICGEKDSGEPLWRKEHKGYDFYSAHLFLKEIGKLRTLAVGDYKVSFGQGLVISNDISLWKSALMIQPEKRNNGFRRHFSTNETDFFRGVASTFSFGKIEASLFYSSRGTDATVSMDSITSIKTDGLHRLVRERDKKNAFTMHTIGGNIRYATPDIVIGLTGIRYDYGDLIMNPEPKPYNLYYFRGNKNSNASIDYLWKNHFIKIYGETAVSENKALATMNGIQWVPFSSLAGLVLYRNYSKRYQAYFGNAFSQNTGVQNEEGIYLGLQWMPFSYWKFLAYADFFRFPWLKYQVDAPSHGCEYKIQGDYLKTEKFTASMSYVYSKKEKNVKKDEQKNKLISPYERHRLRAQFDYSVSSVFRMRTSVEGIYYIETNREKSCGWILGQNGDLDLKSFPLKVNLYAAYFKSDDYQSRVYSREKNLLYAFSLPSFYGEGFRLSSVLRWCIAEKVDFSLKLGWTHYVDRELIGTDLEEIKGHNKMDLNTSLRWKF